MTLITRYRPKTFDDVVGQDEICNSLADAIKNNTSHSFLFSGPSGVGKTTLARIAAYEAGSRDKDIQEIDAATFSGIDDMRAITNGLLYKPFGENAVKSIILDEAHMISKAGWNSLLKSIEEPPSYVYWFLCTTEPGRIIQTVRTRCTSYALRLVPKDLIMKLLEDVAKKEKLSFKGNEGLGILELCVREAGGSPRQALVNLGLCADARTRAEAATLLKSAQDSPEAVDLARALVEGAPWPRLQPILADLKDVNAESIRQVVREYLTTVILGAKNEDRAGRAAEILEPFSQPFPSGDGISPVIMACAKLCWRED